MKIEELIPAHVHLVIFDSCDSCDDIFNKLMQLRQEKNQLSLEIINLDHGEEMPGFPGTIITPSIFINHKLWRTGTVALETIARKLAVG